MLLTLASFVGSSGFVLPGASFLGTHGRVAKLSMMAENLRQQNSETFAQYLARRQGGSLGGVPTEGFPPEPPMQFANDGVAAPGPAEVVPTPVKEIFGYAAYMASRGLQALGASGRF